MPDIVDGRLDVGDGHQMYYEVHGHGKPVVVLHGGPGGGLQHSVLRYFGPEWRVILYDQRGCGRSTPYAQTKANTTWHLVADLERLRTHLGLGSWTVFGGSWGTTLALAYASKHAHVDAMILSGVYLAEPWESRWMYTKEGAARLFPEAWRTYSRGLSGRRLTAYYGRLLHNRRTRKAAAAAWWKWETTLSHLTPIPDRTPISKKETLAILEHHYFSHNCWLRPGQLLRAARRFRFPVHIVQGRFDLVCPAASAVALAEAIPHAKLTITEAGHAASESADALRAAIKSLV